MLNDANIQEMRPKIAEMLQQTVLFRTEGINEKN
jgi:hypothetical protein